MREEKMVRRVDSLRKDAKKKYNNDVKKCVLVAALLFRPSTPLPAHPSFSLISAHPLHLCLALGSLSALPRFLISTFLPLFRPSLSPAFPFLCLSPCLAVHCVCVCALTHARTHARTAGSDARMSLCVHCVVLACELFVSASVLCVSVCVHACVSVYCPSLRLLCMSLCMRVP